MHVFFFSPEIMGLDFKLISVQKSQLIFLHVCKWKWTDCQQSGCTGSVLSAGSVVYLIHALAEPFVSDVPILSCFQLSNFLLRLYQTDLFLLLISVVFKIPLFLLLDILGKTTRCWCVIHVTKGTILSVYNLLWILYRQMVGNVK